MTHLEQFTFDLLRLKKTRQSETEGLPHTIGKQRSWDAADVAKLMPILGVVEKHLRQLVHKPGGDAGIHSVFRSMSGLYRYSAQKGMRDFCDLAYEVAQAFDPARHTDPKLTQRVAFLALVAVGQMRCLLSPIPEKLDNQESKGDENTNPSDPCDLTHKAGERAKEIIIGLLTEW